MKLKPNWRAVLRHAWSVRLNALAVVLSGAEVVVGIYANDPPIPRGTFALLALAVTVASGAARFVSQTSITPEGDA